MDAFGGACRPRLPRAIIHQFPALRTCSRAAVARQDKREDDMKRIIFPLRREWMRVQFRGYNTQFSSIDCPGLNFSLIPSNLPFFSSCNTNHSIEICDQLVNPDSK